MKILESITSGYKKIAAGIAIVSFLAIMYFALIPGGSMAHVYGPDGGILSGVFVFIKEWPQYNDTTDIDGTYSVDQVPIGEYTMVAMGNDSYAPNITLINVTQGTNPPRDITMSPAIKYYLPYLYQRIDGIGSDYESAIQVQNSGITNASVEVLLRDDITDTLVANEVFLVQPNESLIRQPFEIMDPRPYYFGPTIVKSDVPIQVQGYIKTQAAQVYSIAPSFNSPSTKLYIPYLYQRTDGIGSDYDSGLQIFNPTNESTEVTVKLFSDLDGSNATFTYSVGAKEELQTKIATMLPGVTIWFGTAEINTSVTPILAQAYIRTTASKIYSIAPSLDSTVTNAFIPYLYQRTDHVGKDYDSGLQIWNPGDVSSTVNITLYSDFDGSNATFEYTVAPKKLLQTKIGTMLPGATIWFGTANITSVQPIAAQGYIRTTNSKVYSVAPQVRKPGSAIDVHIPYLYSPLSGTHDAGVQVFNPNNGDANVNIKFYYANGTLAGSTERILNASKMYQPKVFDIVPKTQDFVGYAIVGTNQPVVAQGFIRTISSNIYGVAPPVER